MEAVLARGPKEERNMVSEFLFPVVFEANTWIAIVSNTKQMVRLEKIVSFSRENDVSSPWIDAFDALLQFKESFERFEKALGTTGNPIADDLPNQKSYNSRALDAFLDWIDELFEFV